MIDYWLLSLVLGGNMIEDKFIILQIAVKKFFRNSCAISYMRCAISYI